MKFNEGPQITKVVFALNPFGGWYAKYYDSAGKFVDEKYFLGTPRWWFKLHAKRVLRKSPLTNGYSVSVEGL